MAKFGLAMNIYERAASGIRSLSHTNPVSKIDINGIRYIPSSTRSEVNLGNSTVGEFLNYAKKIFEEGSEYKPVIENIDSPLGKYLKHLEQRNKERLMFSKAANSSNLSFKVKFKPIQAISGNWNESPSTRLKDFTNYKNFLFDNAENYNITKEQYQEIADEVARLSKEIKMNNPEIRKEIRENLDKIMRWNDIFHTQCQDWKTVNKHIFYDETEYLQAVDEFKAFVENISGKKVLIPTKSRMSLGTSFLGVLNNPENYEYCDYILISHGRGSSLIQDLNHPDAWRFSDNPTIKVWDYIEQNVPKGKRVLVNTCEEHGIELAGKTAEEMVDINGVKMLGIGDPVAACGVGVTEDPLKICESGIRHIVGHANSKRPSRAISLRTSCANENIPMSKDTIKPTFYQLDFSKYTV